VFPKKDFLRPAIILSDRAHVILQCALQVFNDGESYQQFLELAFRIVNHRSTTSDFKLTAIHACLAHIMLDIRKLCNKFIINKHDRTLSMWCGALLVNTNNWTEMVENWRIICTVFMNMYTNKENKQIMDILFKKISCISNNLNFRTTIEDTTEGDDNTPNGQYRFNNTNDDGDLGRYKKQLSNFDSLSLQKFNPQRTNNNSESRMGILKQTQLDSLRVLRFEDKNEAFFAFENNPYTQSTRTKNLDIGRLFETSSKIIVFLRRMNFNSTNENIPTVGEGLTENHPINLPTQPSIIQTRNDTEISKYLIFIYNSISFSIIGYPGSNKTTAVDLIRNSCLETEEALDVTPDKSGINSSATIKSLLHELKNSHPRLIQLWEELTTLMQSFGLYKGGAGSYDRLIIYTLYNTNHIVRRQTVKSPSVAIVDPVLNIGSGGHPGDIFDSVVADNEAKFQINRLAGALHNVRIAGMVLEIVRDQQQGLSYHDFKKDTMERIKSAVGEFKRNKRFETISSVTAQSSLALMDYYICQKKIYPNRKIEETLEELRAQFEEQNDEGQQENQFSNQIPEVERNPHKTILLSPEQKVLWEYLMKHHGGFKSKQLQGAARELAKEGL
ncbi:unnamed protein product, partial [Didymodactylos carnosus]